MDLAVVTTLHMPSTLLSHLDPGLVVHILKSLKRSIPRFLKKKSFIEIQYYIF